MKAKVLKRFKDKYSGEIYKEGDVLNITKERFAEILTVAPLVEEVKAQRKKAAVSEPVMAAEETPVFEEEQE